MVFPLLKNWLKPWLPSTVNSNSNKKAYRYNADGSGFVTIGGGGGGGSASNRGRSGPQSRDISANMTFDNESEEHIVKHSSEIKMKPLQTSGGTQRSMNGSKDIIVETQVSITTGDVGSQKSGKSF